SSFKALQGIVMSYMNLSKSKNEFVNISGYKQEHFILFSSVTLQRGMWTNPAVMLNLDRTVNHTMDYSQIEYLDYKISIQNSMIVSKRLRLTIGSLYAHSGSGYDFMDHNLSTQYEIMKSFQIAVSSDLLMPISNSNIVRAGIHLTSTF